MLHRWYLRWLRGRRWLRREEWIAWVLGPAEEGLTGVEPGMVLVQIDGLSRQELERALERGRMPFLRRLLQRESYRLHDFYSGLPSTTFAVQSELFYGLKTAVPAVGFRIRGTGEVDMILDPPEAEQREAEIAARNGPPLLAGGSAYGDALKGGAAEPHFCAASLTLRGMWRRVRLHLWPVLAVLYFPTFLRIAGGALLALFEATAEAWKGVRRGHKFWHEFTFIRNRVAVDLLLREWQTYSGQIDAVRGLPTIHVNYLGYDEKAHRRGPKTVFAHRSLRGIDRSIRCLWEAAARSSRRDYDVWIYGDHGQEQTAPYPQKFGQPIEEAVRPVIERFVPPDGDKPSFESAAIGPVGYIYPRQRLDDRQVAEAAEALVRDAHAPTVLYEDAQRRIAFRNGAGTTGVLPEQTADVVGPDHPFLNELREDLVAMCRHPEAGQLVLLGWRPGAEPISFADENGAHGGPGLTETHAFALLPFDAPPPSVLVTLRVTPPPHHTEREEQTNAANPPGTARAPVKSAMTPPHAEREEHTPAPSSYYRPLDLRNAALQRLGRTPRSTGLQARDRPARESQPPSITFRVVTYNVHSCIGLDGKMSPQRIARVLAQCDADIVALQELDVRRLRTRGRDQAEEIARELGMSFYFYPAIELADEKYGDAILSRHPMRLVQAALLPGVTPARSLEPRGAQWVEVTLGPHQVQVLNTHLGLNAQEQQEQVAALLGRDWLGHPDCREPVILCGDLNFGPRSPGYRQLATQLRDTQRERPGRPKPTCPSLWPLARIDHIFVRGPLQVKAAAPAATRLARHASDHLPLVAELQLP